MSLVEQDFLVQAAFQEGIWEVGIDPPIQFASGKLANNKVDWERLFRHEENPHNHLDARNFELVPAGEFIVNTMVEVIDRLAPDTIGGVKTGGQRFAAVVARELQIPLVHVDKAINEPGLKMYKYASSIDLLLASEARRMVVAEDATSELTSLVGYLSLLADTAGEREVIVRAIQRRDDGTNELALPGDPEIDWLIELEMPNIMTAEHPTYQRWGHLAVGEFAATTAATTARS